MNPRLHYLRLLDEVNEKFDKPDWATVREWLANEVQQERVRREPFVPTSVPTLDAPTEPALQPGDAVPTPLLSRHDLYRVPPRCQFAASLHALGSVEIGEGVQVVQDVLASETIYWQGGAHSSARNLVAPHVHTTTPPGAVLGGIWCDFMTSDREGVDIAPGLVVQGMVVMDAPRDGRVVVGAESHLGGLYLQEGDVETQRDATISYLQTGGSVQAGRENRLGYVQARRVLADAGCRIGVIVSEQTVDLGRGCIVDMIRAQGDIVLDKSVTVTGNLLLSEHGTFQIPSGESWHSRRDHWFYVLPGELFQPYRDDAPRPPESRLVAIRSLTHALWQQIERLSGRL